MLHLHLPTTTVIPTIITLLLLHSAAAYGHRRLLHQPFFPLSPLPTPTISQPPISTPSPSPSPQPHPQPKYPFSTIPPPIATTPTTTTTDNPFFPSSPSPPPPPPSNPNPTTTFPTFPANISSLVLPSSSSHSSHKPIKLVLLIVSLSLFSILVFAYLLHILLRRRRLHNHHDHQHQPLKSDSLRLFPSNLTPSDTTTTTIAAADISKKPPPQLFPRRIPTPTSTSSEFLYLGTLVSSRDPDYATTIATENPSKVTPLAAASPLSYQRLDSPELRPLPPLPRQQKSQEIYRNTHASLSEGEEEEEENDHREEEFFSPRGSTGNNISPYRTRLSPTLKNSSTATNEFNKSRSLNALNFNSSVYSVSSDNSPSVVLNTGSPASIQSKSPESLVSFLAPLPRFFPPPPAREPRKFSPLSPSSTEDEGTRDCSPRASDFSGVSKGSPPPPPPMPPSRLWEPAAPLNGPPELVGPSRKGVVQNANGEKGSWGDLESQNGEMMKPKLKPLHWDKVRASSDRAMVWDQLKSSSFQ